MNSSTSYILAQLYITYSQRLAINSQRDTKAYLKTNLALHVSCRALKAPNSALASCGTRAARLAQSNTFWPTLLPLIFEATGCPDIASDRRPASDGSGYHPQSIYGIVLEFPEFRNDVIQLGGEAKEERTTTRKLSVAALVSRSCACYSEREFPVKPKKHGCRS